MNAIKTARELVALLIIRGASVKIQSQAFRVKNAAQIIDNEGLAAEAEIVYKHAKSFGLAAARAMPNEEIKGVEEEKEISGYNIEYGCPSAEYRMRRIISDLEFLIEDIDDGRVDLPSEPLKEAHQLLMELSND